MWEALGATGVFTIVILIWWMVVTDNNEKTSDTTVWTAPVGVLSIAAVYILTMYFFSR